MNVMIQKDNELAVIIFNIQSTVSHFYIALRFSEQQCLLFCLISWGGIVTIGKINTLIFFGLE